MLEIKISDIISDPSCWTKDSAGDYILRMNDPLFKNYQTEYIITNVMQTTARLLGNVETNMRILKEPLVIELTIDEQLFGIIKDKYTEKMQRQAATLERIKTVNENALNLIVDSVLAGDWREDENGVGVWLIRDTKLFDSVNNAVTALQVLQIKGEISSKSIFLSDMTVKVSSLQALQAAVAEYTLFTHCIDEIEILNTTQAQELVDYAVANGADLNSKIDYPKLMQLPHRKFPDREECFTELAAKHDQFELAMAIGRELGSPKADKVVASRQDSGFRSL